MNIFNLNIKDAEKELDKVLNNTTAEELSKELKESKNNQGISYMFKLMNSDNYIKNRRKENEHNFINNIISICFNNNNSNYNSESNK